MAAVTQFWSEWSNFLGQFLDIIDPKHTKRGKWSEILLVFWNTLLLVLLTKYEHEFDNKIPTPRIATNITHISISDTAVHWVTPHFWHSNRLMQVFNGVRSSEQVSLPHPVHGRCQEGWDRQPRSKLEILRKKCSAIIYEGLPRGWTDVSLQCPSSTCALRVNHHHTLLFFHFI